MNPHVIVTTTRQLATEIYFNSIIYNIYNPNQIRQLCQSTIINAILRQKAEEKLQQL